MHTLTLLQSWRLFARRVDRRCKKSRGAMVARSAVLFTMLLATWFLGYRVGFNYLLQRDFQRAVDTGASVGTDAMQHGSDQVQPAAPDLT